MSCLHSPKTFEVWLNANKPKQILTHQCLLYSIMIKIGNQQIQYWLFGLINRIIPPDSNLDSEFVGQLLADYNSENDILSRNHTISNTPSQDNYVIKFGYLNHQNYWLI